MLRFAIYWIKRDRLCRKTSCCCAFMSVGAVSAMLKDVIEEEASDGTYSARSTKTRAP
jgi:hypothetical protein